ncbi:snRNA-activating protein complex subunit 1-like [Anabas testudineus]|uniref:snRNA-activating protein complex subunit 1-like n=1 Tax=Anabas testudineus TaxID=64144 RepID=UPI000E45624E|nr:snRNA-activating protein complex subunit 1-like [Anabas testudineus]
MPRVLPIYSDFFFGPLTQDVEELLARFQHNDSVRYELFSSIWREMRFSDVFTGITNMGEMKRYCRVALATAVKYFLPPYSYQIRVGGLYLMFAFYHTQLALPPVKIRLALKDWEHVQKFVKDTVDAQHHDVIYIYEKLVAVRAIHYTAMPHFLTFQKQRKPKKQHLCADFLGRTTAVQELFSADILEEMANIQTHYEKLKTATVESSSQVSMTHPEFVSSLRDPMSDFFTWQEKKFSQNKKDKNSGDEDEEQGKPAEEESSSRRAKLLSSIKNKSYSNFQEAPKSRRHRQAETVDSSSSGPELVQETAQKKRPPSLRARTWKSLGMTQEDSKLQAWLLSAPDQQERLPVKRTSHVEPYRP